MKRDTLLLIADGESDADMLYASGLRTPEPFIFLQSRGRTWAVVSEAQWDRARRESRVGRVLPAQRYHRAALADGEGAPDLGAIAARVVREARIKKVFVPPRFPLGFARQLRSHKIKVKVRPGWMFPDRQFKSAAEVKMVSAALTMAEIGLAEAVHALRRARIARDGRLLLNGNPLTAERLRAIIDRAVFDAGGTPRSTVVAGGAQSGDPHETGHGRLRANAPIVLGVSPRSQRTGYFGRITRTVVRGRASEELQRVYQSVEAAHTLMLEHIQPGVCWAALSEQVSTFFRAQGYGGTQSRGTRPRMLHGLGQGLGLELEESPGLNGSFHADLRPGHVLAIRPALYQPLRTGVRLEDVVLVTPTGAKNLTRFEKEFVV